MAGAMLDFGILNFEGAFEFVFVTNTHPFLLFNKHPHISVRSNVVQNILALPMRKPLRL